MQPLHATAVAFDGRAVLLTGKSGSGKSTLALELIGLGGTLVADDRVVAEARDGVLWLDAPGPTRGLIEARGVGMLACPSAPAIARLVVEMDVTESQRLPDPDFVTLAGIELPLLRRVESPAFAAMLRLYLAGGETG